MPERARRLEAAGYARSPPAWVDTKVCAIDATWSGLRLTLRRG